MRVKAPEVTISGIWPQRIVPDSGEGGEIRKKKSEKRAAKCDMGSTIAGSYRSNANVLIDESRKPSGGSTLRQGKMPDWGSLFHNKLDRKRHQMWK